MTARFTHNWLSVSPGTANQITSLGTGTAHNVQGSCNFTLVVQCAGTGTAVATLQGSQDGTNWYDILYGTAKSATNVTTTTSRTASNEAHGKVRAKMKVRAGGFSNYPAATFKAWVIAN